MAKTAGNPHYHMVARYTLPGGDGWDYMADDSSAHRLYISRGTHVQIMDTDSGKLVGDLVATDGVHGIAIDDADNKGFTSNGRANTVTEFDLTTLQTTADIPVGDGPDCIIFDPATKRVFTFNGRGHTSTAIDAASGKVIGTIALPGKPEYAVADGNGSLYDNIEDMSEIVKIDAAKLTVTATWPLAPGTSPSGLSMDRTSRRLFSVCDNQKMVVVNADTGAVVATPTIGSGPDACVFDPKSQVALSPNGEDGTLTVVHEDTPDTYRVVNTITTQQGARTMALDPTSHHFFTVTADAQPLPAGTATTGHHHRTYVDGTFVVLEYAP
jgi:DNA-binding beta-propeller fold protein YncE